MGILLSVPIGVIYNIIVSSISYIAKENIDKENFLNQNYFVEIAGSLIGLIMAFFLFGKGSQFDNKIVKYGLIFGALSIAAYTLISNWTTISPIIKLILFVVLFFAIIIISYKFIKDGKEKTIKKKSHE